MKLIFVAMRNKIDDHTTLEEVLDALSCREKCVPNSCDICEGNCHTFIQELFEKDELDDQIELAQWKHHVYQLQLTKEMKPLNQVIQLFIDNFINYKHHIYVKLSQSLLFRQCVETSNDEIVVMQVDFAENFKCISQNEVQSAYLNQHAIAIFTVVIWAGDRKFSKVCVSDDTSHSKFCVLLYLHEIIEELKIELPRLKAVKMFSDGCAGQFKNRWILSLVLFAKDFFGVDLTWQFFAPGHGKEAVDGIGGSVKRAVYQRIMTGKNQVYSADAFDKCLKESIPLLSTSKRSGNWNQRFPRRGLK